MASLSNPFEVFYVCAMKHQVMSIKLTLVLFSYWFQKEPSILVLTLFLFLMEPLGWSWDQFFEVLKLVVLVIFTKHLKPIWFKTRFAPSSLHTTKPKKNVIIVCSILRTSQNKEYVILLMYNKLNTRTCVEYRAKLVHICTNWSFQSKDLMT